MEKDIFNWKNWDELDTMCFAFYNVEFIKDFGAITKETKFSVVNMDYTKGELIAYAEDGQTTLHTIKFKLVAE